MTAATDGEQVGLLVRQYAGAAAEHGRATEAGDSVAANRAFRVIATAYRALRRHGPEASLALLPLLEAEDLSVRVWAASHALEFAPERGVPVLEAAKETPRSLVGFSAARTLDEWRAGRLEFP